MSWSTRRRWPSCRSPRRFDRRFQRQRPDASSTTRDLHNKLVLECRSEDNSAADFGCGAPLKNDGPPFTEESIQMAKRKANAAFMKPVQPDDKLAEVVGSKPLPRTELTKKLWAYIKKNGLQDKKNRRMIHADDSLKPVFGKQTVNMFEMTKLVNKHVK